MTSTSRRLGAINGGKSEDSDGGADHVQLVDLGQKCSIFGHRPRCSGRGEDNREVDRGFC